jgi:hypothetical protein
MASAATPVALAPTAVRSAARTAGAHFVTNRLGRNYWSVRNAWATRRTSLPHG